MVYKRWNLKLVIPMYQIYHLKLKQEDKILNAAMYWLHEIVVVIQREL